MRTSTRGSVVLISATTLPGGPVFPATRQVPRRRQRRFLRRCWRPRGLAAPRATAAAGRRGRCRAARGVAAAAGAAPGRRRRRRRRRHVVGGVVAGGRCPRRRPGTSAGSPAPHRRHRSHELRLGEVGGRALAQRAVPRLALLEPREDGVATKIDEYAPVSRPTNSARAKSRSASAAERVRAHEQQRRHRQQRDDRRVDRAHQHLVQRPVRPSSSRCRRGRCRGARCVLLHLVEHDDGVVEREPEDREERDDRRRA